jgi:hypothetical protein
MQKEFAAFIGIDRADRKHDVCLAVPTARLPEQTSCLMDRLAEQRYPCVRAATCGHAAISTLP